MPRAFGLGRCIAVAVATAACTHVGEFVWVDDFKEPPAPTETDYVIGRGDLLSVKVFNQDAMSGRARVRDDGKISLPFVNDVDAAGGTTTALSRRVQAKLADYINKPIVTVSLEEPALVQVSVVGDVSKPGAYRIEPGAGVLQALALAGGLTQYASRDRIFVLRRNPATAGSPAVARIRFTYESLAQARGKAGTFRLRDGDILVVE